MASLGKLVGAGALAGAAAAGFLVLLRPRSAFASEKGDKRVAGGPDSVEGDILQTVGKHWILTNKIADGKMAANYGWHYRGRPYGMRPDGREMYEPSVSLPGVRVIQGIGTAHDRAHADYGQNCVLAAQSCIYKGEPARLSDLLVDPEASKLLSVEGPLLITRQPGVPKLDVLEEAMRRGAAGTITRDQVAALPNDIAKREAILLQWVEEGRAEVSWATITTGDLSFNVFADALKFGGVRVEVAATLEQQIADRMDCSLLTARMADLVFAGASRVILPIPLPISSSTATMLEESKKNDEAAKVSA